MLRKLRPTEVMQIFDEFDLDHSRALDLAEFKAALQVLGVGLPHDKAAHVFRWVAAVARA